MQPTFLIASPQMRDPFFEKTLVLVWHYDEEGALGVVVNKVLEHSLPEILAVDGGVDLRPYDQNLVGWGGPVEGTSATVVARGQVEDSEGWLLPDGLAVTKSQDALLRLLSQRTELLLVLGYAGWGPGQLDREIAEGGWLATDLDAELLFDIPAEDRWEAALATLGLTPGNVWMQPIDE
ncbi:MAG: YqgE/AlgH family protein [Deltaproteobacteria bacterium]|nr:MAG: YqgE/AlgH family protein [Deltaproteobacteria bacterium]